MEILETRNVKPKFTTAPSESVAANVKLNVPACAGMPLMTPAGDTLRLLGNGEVDTADHVTEAPPVNTKVWEYGTPTVASRSDWFTTPAIGEIVSVKVRTPMLPAESVACNVKVKVPVASGVPLTRTVPAANPPGSEFPARSANPGGKANALTVYGGVPPVGVMVKVD